MVSCLIFQSSYSKAKNNKYNALLTKTVKHHVNNETSNVLQHGFNNRTNFTQQLKKRHVATKQGPPEVSFVRKKERRNFLQ